MGCFPSTLNGFPYWIILVKIGWKNLLSIYTEISVLLLFKKRKRIECSDWLITNQNQCILNGLKTPWMVKKTESKWLLRSTIAYCTVACTIKFQNWQCLYSCTGTKRVIVVVNAYFGNISFLHKIATWFMVIGVNSCNTKNKKSIHLFTIFVKQVFLYRHSFDSYPKHSNVPGKIGTKNL